MKQLEDFTELVGKTIKYTRLVDSDEKLVLVFEDDSFTVVEINRFGECVELVLDEPGCLSDVDLLCAGLMTKADYIRKSAEINKKAADENEASERHVLRQLKVKYPDA
ncbi:MAG: hypothetical protein COA47_10150 [Robiginitomaculum sp.]|nr:MAG: hypothetical protein COA47_10150 [Robiginitomaculum sp.]